MRNFISHGEIIDYTATKAVASGEVVILGGYVGISPAAYVSGDAAKAKLGGVYALAANAGEAFAIGDVLYWDATNKRLTTTATNNTKAGGAWVAKASADTVAQVRLNTNV